MKLTFKSLTTSTKSSTPRTSSALSRATAQSKSGFTIVELMLAMTFVATLLIAIAIVTINIVTIYQKGLALKAVNNVGRSLIEEVTTTINSAPAVDTTSLCHHLAAHQLYYENPAACIQDHAYRYVYNDRYDDQDRQYSGVFCTGNFSYLWNTRYGINDRRKTLSLKYRDQAGNEQTIGAAENDRPRLIRIQDRTYRVCTAFLEASASHGAGNTDNWELDITSEYRGTFNSVPRPTDGYLNAFDLDLLLYEFTIQPISQDSITLRTYMAGNFILATDRGGIDITTTGDYCQNTYKDADGNTVNSTSKLGNLGAEFNYCAINKFNFAARTAGV